MFTHDLNTADNEEDRKQISTVLLQSQVIHAAIIMGSLVLTTVLTLVSVSQDDAKDVQRNQEKQEVEIGDEPSVMLVTVAAGVATLGLLGSIAVPMLQRNGAITKLEQASRNNAQNESDQSNSSLNLESLLRIYQTSHILGMAILESCLMLCASTLFLGAPIWIVAFPAFLIVVMALRIPVRSKIESWIDQQSHLLEIR